MGAIKFYNPIGVTVQIAALAAGVKEETIRNRFSLGNLKRVKLGDKTYVPISEMNRLAAAGKLLPAFTTVKVTRPYVRRKPKAG